MFRSMKSPLTISFSPIFSTSVSDIFRQNYWLAATLRFPAKLKPSCKNEKSQLGAGLKFRVKLFTTDETFILLPPSFCPGLLYYSKKVGGSARRSRSLVLTRMWAILTLQPVILIAGVLFSFFFQNFICFIILQQLKQFYYIVSFLLLATENQVYGKKNLKELISIRSIIYVTLPFQSRALTNT